MSTIDWNNNKEQISNSFRLSDNDVNEGLLALEHARKLYDTLKLGEIPDRITLLNNKGIAVHTIRTNGGKQTTVFVSPESLLTMRNILIVIVTCFISGSLTYYCMQSI